MNFYTKVLSRFATVSGLKLTLRVDVAPPDGFSSQAAEDMRVALRELGNDLAARISQPAHRRLIMGLRYIDEMPEVR